MVALRTLFSLHVARLRPVGAPALYYVCIASLILFVMSQPDQHMDAFMRVMRQDGKQFSFWLGLVGARVCIAMAKRGHGMVDGS